MDDVWGCKNAVAVVGVWIGIGLIEIAASLIVVVDGMVGVTVGQPGAIK